MRHHFFVFGSFPAISRAELLNLVQGARGASVLGSDASGAVISGLSDQGATDLFGRLGGAIKVAVVSKSIDPQSALAEVLDERFSNDPGSSKFLFGLSGYGQNLSTQMLFRWGLEVKRGLKAQGRSSRLVTSTETVLSSVVVQKNHLMTTGVELIIVRLNNEYWVGRTLAVQEFEQWGQRDMERPRRNARRGMLPPKIARVMVNLAVSRGREIGAILDPFCGSGTILMEALQLGYEVIGSDISKEAVEDTKENLQWFQKSSQHKVFSSKLFTSDVRDLSRQVKPQSVDAIVTEPDLGPPQARLLRSEKEIERIREKLSGLYLTSLAQFSTMLKPSGRVVISLPVWRTIPPRPPRERVGVRGAALAYRLVYSIDDLKIISRCGFTIVTQDIKGSQLNARPSLLYGRPEQFVWREILVLERKTNT